MPFWEKTAVNCSMLTRQIGFYMNLYYAAVIFVQDLAIYYKDLSQVIVMCHEYDMNVTGLQIRPWNNIIYYLCTWLPFLLRFQTDWKVSVRQNMLLHKVHKWS